jgi:hypothetical protein
MFIVKVSGKGSTKLYDVMPLKYSDLLIETLLIPFNFHNLNVSSLY